MQVRKYTSNYKTQWNEFVKKSVSGCFLHERDFMEYHADRFEDHSLMFFDKDELVACLPAHLQENNLKSHAGLTYGGLLLANAKAEYFTNLMLELVNYGCSQNFGTLLIKLPPSFYNDQFAQELEVFKDFNVQIIDELTDLYVDFEQEWMPSPKKTAGYRNGKFDALRLIKSDDLEPFWNHLLIPQLEKRHASKPIHTLDEINLLKSTFPENILQFYAVKDKTSVAGITIFDFGSILKVQYAASNKLGFDTNAMDFLYLEIMKKAQREGKRYVDLGTANLSDGSINKGLFNFKKQLGASSTLVKTLELDLRL